MKLSKLKKYIKEEVKRLSNQKSQLNEYFYTQAEGDAACAGGGYGPMTGYSCSDAGDGTEDCIIECSSIVPGGPPGVVNVSNDIALNIDQLHTGGGIDKYEHEFGRTGDKIPGKPDFGRFTVTPQGGQTYTVDKNHREFNDIVSAIKKSKPYSTNPAPVDPKHVTACDCCEYGAKVQIYEGGIVYDLTWMACCSNRFLYMFC